MTLQHTNSVKHIFLADDDQDDRHLFAEALREVDRYAILTEAENGIELMDKLHFPDRLPDFVFLDLNMPKLGGLDCLREIRNHDGKLRNLKVVMLTTSNNPGNIETAYGLGATLYAVKPNSFTGLKTLISNVLNRHGLVHHQRVSKGEFVVIG